MTDSYDRNIDYLRVSLTDRCDLRCTYCMPKCGVDNIPHKEILTLEETARIVRIMAGLGVKKLRITGGEPLIRRNVTGFVKLVSNITGIEDICMTTNGTRLSEYASQLKAAGLHRINISLDTTHRDVFSKITGTDMLGKVLEGIDAAYDAGFPIKINCVPMKGVNDKNLDSVALLAKERPIDVRFIELMPIGCGKEHTGIRSDTVLHQLEENFGKAEPYERTDMSSPAEYYRFSGFCGNIGFISPMSHKFCRYCDRARLTSNGFLKLCLQYPDGADLKTPLRSGCSDDELSEMILAAVRKKPLQHSFSDTDMTDDRKMVQIGG